MGVTGLWKLIDRAGKQVALESLEGKVFAVDASVLLYQALKGMKDEPNAHLHVLFLRLCKLLMYRIKPVFVFDGAAPILKRQTIAARQKRREESSALAQSIRERLKRKTLQRLAIDDSLGRPSQPKKVKTSEQHDLFELPPLPTTELTEEDDYYELPIHNMLYSGELDLSQVRINSEEFSALPLEYQHEILEELKDQTKHDNMAYSMEDKAENFSSLQIAKLVKSNKLTNKIEGLRKEMLSGLTDHAGDPNYSVLQANRVMSEDSTHYLLIKTLTPAADSPNGAAAANPPQSSHSPTSIPVELGEDVNINSLSMISQENQGLIESSDSDSDTSEGYAKEKISPLLDELPRKKPTQKLLNKDKLRHTADLSETDSEVEQKESDNVPSVEAVADSSNNLLDKYAQNSSSSMSQSCATIVGSTISSSNLDYQLDICKSIFDSYTQENLSKKSGTSTAAEDSTSQTESTKTAGEEIMKPGVKPTESSINTGVHHVDADVNLVESTTNNMKADVSQVKADMNLVEPDASLVEPDMNSGEPDVNLVEPTLNNIKPDAIHVEPDMNFPDPDVNLVEPDDEQTATSNPMLDGLAEEILHSSRDLNEVNEELQTNQYSLEIDLQKQQASSQGLTQRIMDDSMELLRLFGVPYVLSPCEAEAQCAKLELLGLCDGTITEDSDVWLFGGCRVLKNFFQQNRYVMSFSAKDIERYCGLDRNKLIAVALVCGSDYTEGIFGAGPVTATEILSEFGQDCDGITAMSKFKLWVDEVKAKGGVLPVSTSNTNVRSNLRRHAAAVPDGFPNRVVVDAYLNPSADCSSESFAWGRPDLDLIRKFARKTLNWSTERVDELVCPVLKKQNTAQAQKKMTDFFSSFPTSINTDPTFQSKRLQHAFSKLTSPKKNLPIQPLSTSIPAKPTKKQNGRRVAGGSKSAKGKQAMVKKSTSVNVRSVKEEACLSEDSD